MTAVLPAPVNLSQPPPGDLGQPAGWARRATVADLTLPHQIRMGGDPVTDRLTVGCNCGWAGGTATTAPQALALYNAHLPDVPADGVAATSIVFTRPWQGLGDYNEVAAHRYALAQAAAEEAEHDRGRDPYEEIAAHWGHR